MSSVTSAESESSPRPDKRPASPAQSPQPKRARPTELSLDHSAWEGDSAPTNSGEQSSIISGSPRIQLPSIFSIEDPFRGEHRRASLPTLSSELSSRGRLPSVAPASRADSESWGTAAGQTASLPGIVRPNSTPGPVHSANGPLKYDDNLRHSSLSGSYTFPPANQAPMYGSVARISGQAERRASYSQSSTSEAAKEEWSFSTPDILLPSASTNGPVHSPSRTPPAPPPSSSLVDRPQKKRGKLPKPTTDFLKDWLHRHSDHPYPSEDEKKQLCAATGLSMSQVSNWMINVGLPSTISTPVHTFDSH